MKDRARMILELPDDIQMAVRLRAVKNQTTNGEVIERAIEEVFPKDLAEARKVIKGAVP